MTFKSIYPFIQSTKQLNNQTIKSINESLNQLSIYNRGNWTKKNQKNKKKMDGSNVQYTRNKSEETYKCLFVFNFSFYGIHAWDVSMQHLPTIPTH